MTSAREQGKRNFHVPLSPALYEDLRDEARRQNRPATGVVREAITVYLRQQAGDEKHRRISAYAARQAGSEADLDEALEGAAIEHLRNPDEAE